MLRRIRLILPLLILLAAALPARADVPAPDPRFGIVEAYVNAQAATEAGAGYSRVILRWDVIQPASPFDWKPANVPDPFIEAELAAGRQVVGLLIGTPAWAAVDPAQGARSVPRLDAWSAFVKRMAQQYRGRINCWIIWNEPDVWDQDHQGSQWAGSVQDYKELLKAAYLAVKEVDPGMQVSLAGLTYFWDAIYGRPLYFDRLLDAILADPDAPAHNFYFDVAAYHLYFTPLQALEVIPLAREAMVDRGIIGKEIWINETNAPPSSDASEMPPVAPRFRISPAEQAAFLLQEFSLALSAGAERIEVYKLRNEPLGPGFVEPYGLLRADNSRRPAFSAFQVATRYLAGFRSARLERKGDVYAVTFDRGAQTTTVLWTIGRSPAHVTLRAVAGSGLIVDELGRAQPATAAGGYYLIDLPGASCSAGDCFIGGPPRLLVEEGSPAGRLALASPSPVPSPARPRSTAATVPPRLPGRSGPAVAY